jgi:hypothetical protein
MLEKHFPRPVLFVDADAVVLKRPALFDNFEPDLALYELDWSLLGKPGRMKEVLSGTVYAKYTSRVMDILNRWISVCSSDVRTWEQKILQKLVGDDFYRLPPEYCMIFDIMKPIVNDPIIKHYQASRQYRKV